MKYMECVETQAFGPLRMELKISGHIDSGEVRGFEARIATLEGGNMDVTDLIQGHARELLEARLIQLWDAWVFGQVSHSERNADRAYDSYVDDKLGGQDAG